MDDDEKQWIQDVFNGDLEAYQVHYKHSTSDLIYWEDLELSWKVYPELEVEIKLLIKKRLGYLPHPTVTIPFEPFLRSLYHSFRLGQLNEADFYVQADEHIKLIRNKDMEPNLCLIYDDIIYENYKKTYIPFIQAARERITRFLGYEPKLENSLIAEMWLSKIIAKDILVLQSYITEIDYKAITLIKYREILLTQGQEVANSSSILNTP
ncbi:hypothetical protein [Emticicia fontis]